MLEEAGKFASDVIAPLNSIGDKHGTPFKDGKVTTPPGWKEAYTSWAAAGWNGLASPDDYGGQGLPQAVNAACVEMWNAASMAFGIGPVLTMAAVDALHAYGSDDLKARYLEKLISGEWMGTMQLTEPQAGSDVGALRTKAERASDGTLSHHRPEDLHHLWRARPHRQHHPFRAGAAARCAARHQGHLAVPDSEIPARTARATTCARIRSSTSSASTPRPTCTMVYGDKGGAVGWLIGEEHKGMLAMFKMMNRARLAVGLQGVAIAERATQQALAYARDRKQGPGTIIELSRRQAHAADHARR